MVKHKAINAVAGVTVAAAAAWLSLFFHPRPPAVDCRPHTAVGEVLAGEALKLLKPGARLIVIARESQAFEVPAAAAQLDGCLRALKKSGWQPALLRTVKVNPLRLVGVEPGDFFDLLRQGREDDVIVSFMGPPVLRAEQLQKLGEKRARVLAVCSGAMPAQVDLKSLFEQKLLTVAVISRRQPPGGSSPSQLPPAFDAMFKLITAANLSEVPVPAAQRL
jgi:hypothetical protein